MSESIMAPFRTIYATVFASIFLLLSLSPTASIALSENEINEIISSLGETDEKIIKQLRENFRKIRSEDDVREIISKKNEKENITNLANALGFSGIEKITVGTSHPGYDLFIKVFNKREFDNSMRYKQNVLYVANKDITNSSLINIASNSISRGNYYSNSDNIVTFTKCLIKQKGISLNISIDEKVKCHEITEIIHLLENGNLTVSSDLKNQPVAINWIEISFVSKDVTGFEIHTRDTPTSNYIYKIEKTDGKLFLKAISFMQS